MLFKPGCDNYLFSFKFDFIKIIQILKNQKLIRNCALNMRRVKSVGTNIFICK